MLLLLRVPQAPGSVRFEEFFVFPRPLGGGTQMITSVVWTIPKSPGYLTAASAKGMAHGMLSVDTAPPIFANSPFDAQSARKLGQAPSPGKPAPPSTGNTGANAYGYSSLENGRCRISQRTGSDTGGACSRAPA